MGIRKAYFASLFCQACLKSIIILFITSYFSVKATAHDITQSTKYSALVMDSMSKEVIYAKNANQPRYPASLTKLMTLYLTFDALESGRLTMSQRLVTSHRASKQIPRKLGLKPGEKISVRDCIHSTIILSANDVSVVLAEAIAGSEWNFAKMMNQKAKALGMKRTNFVNSHGCHDNNQYTTAVDMAKLALSLKKNHTKYYSLFSKANFTFKGKVMNGHNHVNRRYEGAEGLKTGYIKTSGFNLITTARKPYGHLIGVVFGGPNAKIRDDHMIEILDLGFCHLSEKKGHYNPKCHKGATLLVARKNSPQNKNIFSIIDAEKPIKTASLNTKKYSTTAPKPGAEVNKTKQLVAENEVENLSPLENSDIKKYSKKNASKKA